MNPEDRWFDNFRLLSEMEQLCRMIRLFEEHPEIVVMALAVDRNKIKEAK
jgi:DNA replication protein DnaD